MTRSRFTIWQAGWLLLVAGLAPAQSLPEQNGPYLAGYRTLTVPGVSGGNDQVGLLVHYPATSSGSSTPLETGAAPCPLVVFGHGFSLRADLYRTLFDHLATHGYVVAALTTEEGLFTGNLPRFIADFQAAVLGLRSEAARPTSPLLGAVASGVKGAAVGHSFGGAAALVAASERPDLFRAVVTMAATATSPQNVDILAATSRLTVPALHLGASQDTIVPPAANLDVIYAATPGTRRMIEIRGGTHSYFHEAWYLDRLVEPPGEIPVAEQQRLIRRYGLTFLEWALRERPDGLDLFLGPTAIQDPALSRQAVALEAPWLFGAGPGRIGTAYRLHPARRPGDTGTVALGLRTGDVPTPYGTLLLDPALTFVLSNVPVGPDAFGTLDLGIPAEKSLEGLPFYFQALLSGPSGSRLSNRWELRIR